jgi:xanthine dehydrogenase accessory factor
VNKELELWQFVAQRLQKGGSVVLLVVAESSGSSPGRRGYKMAVASDGELFGSIGGGVMEVNLVEDSRSILRDAVSGRRGDAETSLIAEQVHQKNSSNASGMICSGKQTVIFKTLGPGDATTVDSITVSLGERRPAVLKITPAEFVVVAPEGGTPSVPTPNDPKSKIQNPQSYNYSFEKASDTDFTYAERLGFKNDLYIIGGGHCALALSEIMSKMDFHIVLFDDRPDLNTIEKNRFAHEIKIIESYDAIGAHVSGDERSYVVVMTLGYVSDGQAIRSLIHKRFRYFGVLGSSAKMTTMLKEFIKEGLPREALDRIRTPIGIPIHSRTPEEIAVSIAAEIISVKNAD